MIPSASSVKKMKALTNSDLFLDTGAENACPRVQQVRNN